MCGALRQSYAGAWKAKFKEIVKTLSQFYRKNLLGEKAGTP